MNYKFSIGDILILEGRGEGWEGINIVRLVKYQNHIEHKYIVCKADDEEDFYGASEKALRRLTKLDKALK